MKRMEGVAHSPALAETGSRPRRRRLLVWGAVGLFLLVLVGWPLYMYQARERALREAVAEADRLDPGWRFEDLEAAREPVPEAENGALQLLAAHQLMPAKWLAPPPAAQGPGIDEILDELAPIVRLDEK